MWELIFTSLLWGLSFGLIKAEVASLDSFSVSAIRLGLSLVLFAPFLRRIPARVGAELAAIGAIQFGAMYCLYISAYRHLAGHEVAVLTVTTPIFIVLIAGAQTGRWAPRDGLAALLAVLGALAIAYRPEKGLSSPALAGVLLVQAANLCFAAGQLLYRRAVRRHGLGPAHRHFAWLYLGAVGVPPLLLLVMGHSRPLWPAQGSQWLALAYLGLVPAGLGFFLWNRGATKVASGALAVLNNLKVPAAVLIAWAVFGEQLRTVPVLVSLALLAAAWFVAHRELLQSAVAGGTGAPLPTESVESGS